MKKLLVLTLLAASAHDARSQPTNLYKQVNVSDPQISADGKSVVCVVSRANVKDDRWDSELVTVDVATGAQRPLTYERRGIASPRWSPDGSTIAFLANATNERDAKRQIWSVSMGGGDPRRLTDAKEGVQQFAWSQDGSQIAFVAADERPPNEDKNNRSFEIVDDDFLVREAMTPSHVWVVPAKGGSARRITSGSWSLPIAHPPGPAPSPLSWSPDGKTIAITRRETAHAGTPNMSRVALVDAATGEVRRLTSSDLDEGQPVFSPDGTRVTYWQARGARRGNATAIWSVPASGGNGLEVTAPLDRNVFRSIWLPDGKSFLTAAHDGTSTRYYVVTLDGNAR